MTLPFSIKSNAIAKPLRKWILLLFQVELGITVVMIHFLDVELKMLLQILLQMAEHILEYAWVHIGLEVIGLIS